jgi:hypothetical protein
MDVDFPRKMRKDEIITYMKSKIPYSHGGMAWGIKATLRQNRNFRLMTTIQSFSRICAGTAPSRFLQIGVVGAG